MNTNTITTKNGNIELTDRELRVYEQLLSFSAAVGFNHEGARQRWNAIVTEYGEMMVPYLKAIALPATACNGALWGTEGHTERMDAVKAEVCQAVQDIMAWGKPLF